MNEAGLFFDGFATADNKIKDSTDKLRFNGNISDYVMANCATVSEVVAVFEKHNLSFLANAMLMFGDQHGDSVIIEGDEFLRIKGDHQVVTNFYQSLTPEGECPCSRYKAAIEALGKGGPVSVESCRDVLAATRQNGRAPTQYSNVYDLKKGLIYLYHFHNFQEVVCIDLKKELKRGAREIDLPSLFSKNKRFEDFKTKRKQDIRDQTEARMAKDVKTSDLKQYEGTYALDVGLANKVNTRFFLKDNRFFVVSETDNKQEQIFSEAKDHFFRMGDYGLQTFVFGRNSNDQVTDVTVKVFGRTFRGVRKE